MNEVEKAIWEEMLDAEMNALYYGYISRRYSMYEKFMLIFIAIISTSAIASLQIWKAELDWFSWSWLWDALSILAVCTSVAAPFLNYGSISNRASALRPIFIDYKNKYEDIWFKRNELKHATLRKKLLSIREDLNSKSIEDSKMPRDKKLLAACQDEIIKSRGLD